MAGLIYIWSFGFGTLQAQEFVNAMSFNIRYDNPEDGTQNWHLRKANVVRMLHFYDLDIIGMQEVLHAQLTYLEQELPDYEYVGIGREDGKTTGEYAPIFYRKSRFELMKSGTFWLSETPDSVSKGWDADLERIATWAILKDRETEQEILAINTHFDHKGDLARVESAKLLKRKITDLGANLPVILTGDFNLTPEAAGIQTIIKLDGAHTLKDAKLLAEVTYGPDWTTCGFDNRPFEVRKTIDYIFVKGISRVSRFAVFAEMLDNLYLSDHCPVFAQLLF